MRRFRVLHGSATICPPRSHWPRISRISKAFNPPTPGDHKDLIRGLRVTVAFAFFVALAGYVCRGPHERIDLTDHTDNQGFDPWTPCDPWRPLSSWFSGILLRRIS